eukprot:TRINITY_DN1153_c0_g1_i1.p1 TRINITY_DN1153_c0_g1~~TRINITY_DN1153_c0_g1_i1.p1  ORF type:complete len:402 (+),score=96.22 TRINITY_DN1153_c0_g1_i1:255-1460(+)
MVSSQQNSVINNHIDDTFLFLNKKRKGGVRTRGSFMKNRGKLETDVKGRFLFKETRKKKRRRKLPPKTSFKVDTSKRSFRKKKNIKVFSHKTKIQNKTFYAQQVVARGIYKGETRYFIRWYGYNSTYCTWECSKNIKNKKFLDKFKKTTRLRLVLNEKKNKNKSKKSGRKTSDYDINRMCFEYNCSPLAKAERIKRLSKKAPNIPLPSFKILTEQQLNYIPDDESDTEEDLSDERFEKLHNETKILYEKKGSQLCEQIENEIKKKNRKKKNPRRKLTFSPQKNNKKNDSNNTNDNENKLNNNNDNNDDSNNKNNDCFIDENQQLPIHNGNNINNYSNNDDNNIENIDNLSSNSLPLIHSTPLSSSSPQILSKNNLSKSKPFNQIQKQLFTNSIDNISTVVN